MNDQKRYLFSWKDLWKVFNAIKKLVQSSYDAYGWCQNHNLKSFQNKESIKNLIVENYKIMRYIESNWLFENENLRKKSSKWAQMFEMKLVFLWMLCLQMRCQWESN